MDLNDWVYTMLLASLVGSTFLIPVHRWLAVMTNAMLYVGLLAGFLNMKGGSESLGYGWSTLVFVLVATGLSVHLFAWFMGGINRSNAGS